MELYKSCTYTVSSTAKKLGTRGMAALAAFWFCDRAKDGRAEHKLECEGLIAHIYIRSPAYQFGEERDAVSCGRSTHKAATDEDNENEWRNSM